MTLRKFADFAGDAVVQIVKDDLGEWDPPWDHDDPPPRETPADTFWWFANRNAELGLRFLRFLRLY